jgi:hypothetical protein
MNDKNVPGLPGMPDEPEMARTADDSHRHCYARRWAPIKEAA